MVVSPEWLQALVRRRARHEDERGAANGDPGSDGHSGTAVRLRSQPGEGIDRSRPIRFTYAGEELSGFSGDTVGSALYAAGRRVFSRSFKYHRPRGLLCCSGRCPNCMMNVDGAPNVRTCVTPARAGMQVRAQNAWPSLETDALAFLGRLETVLPVGFYYKTLMEPRAL